MLVKQPAYDLPVLCKCHTAAMLIGIAPLCEVRLILYVQYNKLIDLFNAQALLLIQLAQAHIGVLH